MKLKRQWGSAGGLVVGLVLLQLVGCSGSPEVLEDAPAVAAELVSQQPDDTLLAVVGDHGITAGELRQRILARFYGRRALEGLIKERLFRDEAERLGLEVTDQEVGERVDEEIRAMLAELGGDRDKLEQALVEQGTSFEERRRDLYHEYRNMLLIERVVLAQRQRWGVTEKALKARYDETFAKTSIRVRHIAFPVNELPETAEQAEVVLAHAHARAQEAHAELTGGADFQELAKQRSGDPVTAPKGGLLGWVQRDALPDTAVAETIFQLPVGVVSSPVLQERYGYHIFLVEERREAQPYAAVRQRLEQEILESPPTSREIQSISRTLRGQAVTILTEPVFEEASTPGKERR